jgi:hypothetical protein
MYFQNAPITMSDNTYGSNVCQWLWPKLLQKVTNEFMESQNAFRSRKDRKKAGPSGISRNIAYSLPHTWGGRNCLLPVDRNIIRQIKEEMGGDDILSFVDHDFAAQAEIAYNSLGVADLNFNNVWDIFSKMLNILAAQI